MARRLTTNQEIAGSTPASVNSFYIFYPILFIEHLLLNEKYLHFAN